MRVVDESRCRQCRINLSQTFIRIRCHPIIKTQQRRCKSLMTRSCFFIAAAVALPAALRKVSLPVPVMSVCVGDNVSGDRRACLHQQRVKRSTCDATTETQLIIIPNHATRRAIIKASYSQVSAACVTTGLQADFTPQLRASAWQGSVGDWPLQASLVPVQMPGFKWGSANTKRCIITSGQIDKQ